MNAVVQFQPQQSQVAHVPSFSMSDMERMALAIAKGGLFGSTDPNAVLTLCMLAQAEGQHPAVVFRDYHIISGKPAKKSEAMQRDFLMAGGKIEWHQLEDACVDATFSHPMGGTVRISWDEKRVQQAQLGGNAMHKKYPRQMKKARVIAEGVRTVWPSATSGLYETGEVQDIVTDRPSSPPMPQAQRARDIKAEPRVIEQDVPQEDAAKDWADKFIADIRAAEDSASLEALAESNAKALARLEKQRPELHTACADTLQARREFFAAEGPADEQRDGSPDWPDAE